MSEVPPEPVVYIVDDDEQVLRAHARLLREHGLATATFESAEAFLERHDALRRGCLVLDVNMPGLDGFALQRRLAEVRPPRPIVFVTGYGDLPMAEEAIRVGAVDFLTKPIPAETLIDAVRRALAQDAEARRRDSQ